MKLKTIAKLVAVLVFAVGTIAFARAKLQPAKDPAKSFVITYRITRSENGQAAVPTGLITKVVSSTGEWKQTTVRVLDDVYHYQLRVRFLDKIATYKLEGDHLDYVAPSDSEFEMNQNAANAEWVTHSPVFVREDSIAGLKVYRTHQPLNDGWVDQAYSPLTRGTYLLHTEHLGDIETTEEAVSIQFRDVSPEEISVPNLPISFDWQQRLEKAMASNPDNSDTIRLMAEGRELVTSKLKAMGRVK